MDTEGEFSGTPTYTRQTILQTYDGLRVDEFLGKVVAVAAIVVGVHVRVRVRGGPVPVIARVIIGVVRRPVATNFSLTFAFRAAGLGHWGARWGRRQRRVIGRRKR